MRASQGERVRKKRKRGVRERRSTRARTHMRVYAPGLAVSSVCRGCMCARVYDTFYRRPRRTSGTAAVRRLARSSPPLPSPRPPALLRPGRPSSRSPSLSLSSSAVPRRLPVSFSPVLHVAAVARACRICGPRSVRSRAQICARRPHDDDRERGFGWI